MLNSELSGPKSFIFKNTSSALSGYSNKGGDHTILRDADDDISKWILRTACGSQVMIHPSY